MSQGERVKQIRNALNLTLERFGEPLGVRKTAISKIENGENNLSEQMTKSICREFNVDYIWLTTGEGEMFVESDDSLNEAIDRILLGENEFHKDLFKALARVSQDDLKALERFIGSIYEEKEARKKATD